MGMIIRLGIKSIGRNPLRTLFTLMAVVLCSGGIVFFSIFMGGSMDMFMNGLTSSYGHVRLVNKELIKNERLGSGYHFVGGVKALRKKLKAIPGVLRVDPRIDVGAYIDHTFLAKEEQKAIAAGQCVHKEALPKSAFEKSKKGLQAIKQSPSSGMGVDPAVVTGPNQVGKKIVKGRMLKAKGKEIVIGQQLAKRLHACIGSKLTLIGKTVDDSMSALSLKVVGIYSMGGSVLDKGFYISFGKAQYYKDLPDQASRLMVFGRNFAVADALAKEVKAADLPKQVVAQSWTEAPLAKYSLPIMNVMLYFIGIVVILLGGIGLFNTMMMTVMERRQEIGIMMALGLPPWRIASVFMGEGLVFGVFGSIVGVSLSLLLSIPIVVKGISLGAEATEKMPFPMSATIKGVITMEGIIMGLVVGIMVTVVGTLLPAYRASQMQPVEVLRE